MGRKNNMRTNRKANNIISKKIESNGIREIVIGMGKKTSKLEFKSKKGRKRLSLCMVQRSLCLFKWKNYRDG
jgi:hypothetical protein